ncbi:hypothetical protein VTK73DRAFT_8706 [Phialemonium thermophilum]|uniref:Uncharacterized protein n=1 Tax=Phialemonium thermophilum TaxID=223376 RepID=A0ABR3W6T9_9PEZI
MAARALLETGHAYRAVVEARKAGTTTTTTTTAAERLGRQTFGYVLVALVSNLERTFTISPASRPLGRELFLVHFGDVGAERTMEIMMAAYDEGKHVGKRWTVGNSAQGETGGGEEDGVGYDQVEEVKVTVLEEDPRWRKVCVDGAIVELERGGWMAVKKAPRALFNVLVDRSVLP